VGSVHASERSRFRKCAVWRRISMTKIKAIQPRMQDQRPIDLTKVKDWTASSPQIFKY